MLEGSTSASPLQGASSASPTPPQDFVDALLSLRSAPKPWGLTLEEIPAPRRLASFAAALSAETTAQSALPHQALSTGRLIVLHEPGGIEAWQGTFRIIVMVRTAIDEEVSDDPLLPRVAWSWLGDALDDAGAGYRALTGTVTRTNSETFGGLELTESCSHAEIRASWTPNTSDLAPHLSAWYALLHAASGNEASLKEPPEPAFQSVPVHATLSLTPHV